MIFDSFKGENWKNEINVAEFIKSNFTAYEGDESFLASPTKRTLKQKERLEKLLAAEMEKGGVLDVDTSVQSSLLAYGPGYLDKKDDIIVGLQTDAPLKRGVDLFGGIRMGKQACEAYGYKVDDNLLNQFKFRTTHNDGVFKVYTDEMKAARHAHLLTGLPDSYGRGRLIGDYRRVALYGVDFLIEQKKKDKKEFGTKPMDDENIRTLKELAEQIDYLAKLKQMAMLYGIDISKPAANAKEAVQWLYFGYLGSVKEQNGAANSMGRVSAFLDIYFEKDIKEGKLTEEQAQEIIDDFVIKLRLVRHLRTPDYNQIFAGDPYWVTLSEGGATTDGRHMITKTNFRILNTLYNLGSSAEPNITILWSKHLPLAYKKFCAKVSIETDSLQYENDDLMRRDYGDDYGIACCVSAMKIGRQQQYFGARCNLPKLLLLALNGGKDEMEFHQIAPQGKVFDGELKYSEVIKTYKEYSKWLAKLYANTMNAIHYMHDRYAYERLTMALHDTQPQKLMAFGISGLSVLVDSLSAIKYAKVTAVKNEEGVIVDFKIEGKYPKYGNDDNRVDKIAKEIAKDFHDNLKQHKLYRNAIPTLSVLTITSNVAYGKNTGNTPDGRKIGEPFAPGANPMHGRDANGAIASLNSVAKIDYCDCQDGISNTMSVVPNVLGHDLKIQQQNLVNLLDGYFAQNAHHLNVNVLNRELLIDAMENPKKYPNLTIRVSGYAVNFNRLTKEQQQEVINRTFHLSM